MCTVHYQRAVWDPLGRKQRYICQDRNGQEAEPSQACVVVGLIGAAQARGLPVSSKLGGVTAAGICKPASPAVFVLQWRGSWRCFSFIREG